VHGSSISSYFLCHSFLFFPFFLPLSASFPYFPPYACFLLQHPTMQLLACSRQAPALFSSTMHIWQQVLCLAGGWLAGWLAAYYHAVLFLLLGPLVQINSQTSLLHLISVLKYVVWFYLKDRKKWCYKKYHFWLVNHQR